MPTPFGIEILDAAGVVQLSIDDRLGRVLGVQAITSSGGNLTDAGLATGTPFWWYLRNSGASYGNQPLIVVASTTLTWSWPVGGGGNGRILYGVY